MKNESNESFARTLADILYSQKKVVQITLVVVFFFFVAYAIFAPEVYRADGSLLFQVKSKKQDLKALEIENTKLSMIKIEGLSSESNKIKSRLVLLKTSQKLIDELPNYNNVDSLANRLADALIVDVDKDSNMISLHLSWDNAEDAKVILDTLMQVYLESRLQVIDSVKGNEPLDNSVTSYLNGWKKKQVEILALIKKHNAPDVDHELINNLALKKDFQIQIAATEKEKISLNEDIKILTSMFNDGEMYLYSFLSNEVLNGLIDSLKTIRREKLETDKIFLPNRIEVKEIDQLFKNSYGELKEKISLYLEKQKSILKGIEKNIADMKSSIKNLEKRNIELKEVAIKMEQLKMEASLLASSYENSYKHQGMQQVSSVLELDVSIFSSAKANLTPVYPIRYQIILMGLILAVLISLCIAFIMNIFDNKIKTGRDIRKYLDVPVLSSINKKDAR